MDERESLCERIVALQNHFFRALHAGDDEVWLALELTMQQLKTLLLVGATGAPAGQIARRLGVSLSTVTGIVDRLEDQGLVQRAEDTCDRRITRVRVTDAGQQILDRLHASRRELLQRIVDRLTVEQLQQVDTSMACLMEAAEAAAAEERWLDDEAGQLCITTPARAQG